MMNKCYINGIGVVGITDHPLEMNKAELKAVNKAIHPSYRDLIPPAMIRRMASGVKMGIYAADAALKDALIAHPDAIITGTGMGCLQDSEKFLKSIIDNEEQFLTPTSFIQSTHNTVGAQIALYLECKGYNFTYVNGGNSFENALLDATLQLSQRDENTPQHFLIGGVDELSEYTVKFFQSVGMVKKENDPISFENPSSVGIPIAEGAAFFTISNQKNPHTYAEVKDVWIQNKLDFNNIGDFIFGFLEKNSLSLDKISLLLLGTNADQKQQYFYDKVKSLFTDTAVINYKAISGEFDTASAFGLAVAGKILKNQALPDTFDKKRAATSIEYVLLVNQYFEKDYSLVLLKYVEA